MSILIPTIRRRKWLEEASARLHVSLFVRPVQEVAKAYHAACTPDFYVFDADRRLVYRGQMDSSRPGSDMPVTGADLRAALDAVLIGRPVATNQKASLGCNIKWKPGNEPEYFRYVCVGGRGDLFSVALGLAFSVFVTAPELRFIVHVVLFCNRRIGGHQAGVIVGCPTLGIEGNAVQHLL